MKVQEELGQTVVEGTAGGGVVRVKVNGHRDFQEIKIDPSAVDPDDVGMLREHDVTEQGVREMLSAHLCRCTGYSTIVRAVLEVAAGRRGPGRS
jgi:hypothetical protein